MPIRTALWRVGAQPEQLNESPLVNEALLETMIIAAPSEPRSLVVANHS
jgi:hypothetical protein